MNTENENNEQKNKPTANAGTPTAAAPSPSTRAQGGRGGASSPQGGSMRRDRGERGGRGRSRPPRGGGGRGRGRGRDGRDRVRPEFDHKVITVRRVARVVAGGRRFSFSVALVAGDRKGSVGVGIGKGTDTALAVEKAMRNAKKNMMRLKLTKTMSIPHDVSAKFSSARIVMIPAAGRGIIAGSSARNVLHLAGMRDVTAKILSGSKNKLNIARVTVEALREFEDTARRTALPKAEISPKGDASVATEPMQSGTVAA